MEQWAFSHYVFTNNLGVNLIHSDPEWELQTDATLSPRSLPRFQLVSSHKSQQRQQQQQGREGR